MKMSAGLSKLKAKKGLKCIGNCINCLIVKALKSVGNEMEVYMELHAVGAMSSVSY